MIKDNHIYLDASPLSKGFGFVSTLVAAISYKGDWYCEVSLSICQFMEAFNSCWNWCGATSHNAIYVKQNSKLGLKIEI